MLNVKVVILLHSAFIILHLVVLGHRIIPMPAPGMTFTHPFNSKPKAF